MADSDASKDCPWWRGAAIYQVYPRSFFDSNADGIGDLQGTREKLDYVKDLGVDGIWISPFFRSPQDDFGYDVSDHVDVDPIFGSLDDFDRMLSAAHDIGLRIVIDQVYSHTSDRHAWFEQSRQDAGNPKADWYVWADAKADGSPPNNWLSVFGGPAWTWDARRRQYYLHNYLSSQPDLNLHKRAVQDALLDVARFWLERGVDGMRLDAINYGMHDEALRDNPPAARGREAATRPWLMQARKYNTNHAHMPAFLERLRQLTDDYGDILTVAEVGGDDPVPVMQTYTQGDERLATAYGFEFLNMPDLTAAGVRRLLAAWPGGAASGWPSWAFSNHDATRVVSRWSTGGEPRRRARLFGLLLAALRGNVFVYQGEELGLPQADVPFAALKDPEAVAHWPHTLGRDGARTPIPWQHDAAHGGFSGAAPWLPVDAAHLQYAVDVQQPDPDSTLNFFRSLMRLRSASPALRNGKLELIDAPGDILAFSRTAADEHKLCVFNLGSRDIDWAPPSAPGALLVCKAGMNGNDIPATLAAGAEYIADAGPRRVT